MKACFLTLAAAAAVTASPAASAVTLLTSEAQVGATYINDFETVLNSGPVTWQVGSLRSISGATPSTTSGSQVLISDTFPQTLVADLSTSYTSVGLFFGNDDVCCSNGFAAILSVYDGANFLGSVSVAANMNDAVDQFIGLSSTQAFNQVQISYGANTSLFTLIDDFQLGNSSAVPEPGTWALMLLGFFGIGAMMRRRQGNVTTKVSYA